VLQCVAVFYSMFQRHDAGKQFMASSLYGETTNRCSALQCVAVCRSVLQCFAVRCRAVNALGTLLVWGGYKSLESCQCCRVLQCVAACCSVLQRVAVCCMVLHGVAECCKAANAFDAVCCSVLQYV